ncbi:MAG TPA: M17 family peptidase N-terminal domain-containing protein, partial [Xylella taiwanensis]
MALQFQLNQNTPATVTTDCVVVGVFADKTLSPAASTVDTASGGRITALTARGDLTGKPGTALLLHDLNGVTAPRVLVVGLGEPDKFGPGQYIKAVSDAVHTLKSTPVTHALLTLSDIPVKDRDASWNIRQAVIAADHAAYRYTATLG